MSSSNSMSGERSQSGGDAADKLVEHSKLEKLKRLRKKFFLKFISHRKAFLYEFGPLIKDWKEQLPNLHEIFTKREVDLLLISSIESSWILNIVEFVVRSGYKDEPDLDVDGKPLLHRTTAINQIDKLSWYYDSTIMKSEVLKDLFKIYDKFHANYTDDSGYTHFYIACKYDFEDVAEKFLELGQDPNCLVPETGDSMLCWAAIENSGYTKIMRLLLKHGADPCLADEHGRTLLHVICQNRIIISISMLLENVNELQRTELIDAQDKWGDTALLLALNGGHGVHETTVRELLRNGADPSLADAKGQTPLHFICQKCNDSPSALTMLFENADELQQKVPIDAQDEWGDTPLLLALKPRTDRCPRRPARYIDTQIIRELLIRGANPSLANAKGQTALHIICQRYENGGLLRLFFEICDEIEKTAWIDARDNEGNAPLHLAIPHWNPEMVELLLRRGADPCLANAEGQTPLHLVARRDFNGDMIRMFLSINEERRRTVGIDARDGSGRTALEWAVTRCLPLVVKSLLDGGADVSDFVFPTARDSDRYGYINRRRLCNAYHDDVVANNDLDKSCRVTKLAAVTGLLAIVELLETRGYALNQDDALKVMGFFAKYGLYESTSTSKEVDDLVDSLFEEMAKKPTYMDDYNFTTSYELHSIPCDFMKACCLCLCEKVSRKFFRDWALDPFMELTGSRLPIERCEIIIDKLKNEDLFNVCLVVAGRSS